MTTGLGIPAEGRVGSTLFETVSTAVISLVSMAFDAVMSCLQPALAPGEAGQIWLEAQRGARAGAAAEGVAAEGLAAEGAAAEGAAAEGAAADGAAAASGGAGVATWLASPEGLAPK